MSFTLSVNGGPDRGFPELGITEGRLEISNQGLDKLQLTLESDEALDAFPAFARVVLAHDGATRFVGWVDQSPSSMSGERRHSSVTITGPWRWLDMTWYTQTKKVVVPDRASSSGSSSGSSGSSNTVQGGVNSTTSTLPPMPTAEELLAAFGLKRESVAHQLPMIGQAIAQSSGLPEKVSISDVVHEALSQVVARYGAVLDYDLSGLPSISLPWAEKQNVTVGSVIRDQLSWAPDRSISWDYSTPVPTLRVGIPTSSKQVTDVGIDATALSLNPRFDLLVRRVKLTYVAPPSQGVHDVLVDEARDQGDALTMNSPHAVEMTFPLQEREPLPSLGLAENYLKAVCNLAIDTSFSFVDESHAWDCLPGQKWGFSGVGSRWSAYTSVCQSISRDLFSNTLSVKLGHPGHLGLQRLLDLSKQTVPKWRREGAGGMGGPGSGNGEPGGGGAGILKASAAVAFGSPADKAEMLANTVITITGPGGTQSGSLDSSGIATFFNLVPGSYIVSAVPSPGWKVKTNGGSSDPGNRVNVSGGGAVAQTTLFLEKIVFKHPFFISLRKDAESGTVYAGVREGSMLFDSLKKVEFIPISGLLPEVVADNSPGWVSVSNGDYVWLEVWTVAKVAHIQFTSNGQYDPSADAWSENSFVEGSISKLPLGKVVLGDGYQYVQQHVCTNLIMRWVNIAGRPALYPLAG